MYNTLFQSIIISDTFFLSYYPIFPSPLPLKNLHDLAYFLHICLNSICEFNPQSILDFFITQQRTTITTIAIISIINNNSLLQHLIA